MKFHCSSYNEDPDRMLFFDDEALPIQQMLSDKSPREVFEADVALAAGVFLFRFERLYGPVVAAKRSCQDLKVGQFDQTFWIGKMARKREVDVWRVLELRS